MPKLLLFSLVVLVMMTACGKEDPEVQSPTETTVTEDNSEQAVDEPSVEQEVDPADFFMPDASIASFLGEGNEYASFTLRTVYMDATHVAVYEDNGGTVMLKVYRIGKDEIVLVKEQAEFYEEYTATAEELEALEPVRTYLAFPLEAGDVVDEQTIFETDALVETPFKKFEQVIVLEREETDDSVNKTYFAKGYGEIKREFRMQEEGQEEFVVTSVLEDIKTE